MTMRRAKRSTQARNLSAKFREINFFAQASRIHIAELSIAPRARGMARQKRFQLGRRM